MIGNPIRYICKAKPFGFGVANDNFWGSEYPILFIQGTRASISLGEREMSSSRIVYIHVFVQYMRQMGGGEGCHRGYPEDRRMGPLKLASPRTFYKNVLR